MRTRRPSVRGLRSSQMSRLPAAWGRKRQLLEAAGRRLRWVCGRDEAGSYSPPVLRLRGISGLQHVDGRHAGAEGYK